MSSEGQAVIDEIVDELKRCFDQCWAEHASRKPSHLFHYTSTEGLVGIVTSRTFFLSDMMASTDQTEIRYGLDVVYEVLREELLREEALREMLSDQL
jgi:hypothetical protein